MRGVYSIEERQTNDDFDIFDEVCIGVISLFLHELLHVPGFGLLEFLHFLLQLPQLNSALFFPAAAFLIQAGKVVVVTLEFRVQNVHHPAYLLVLGQVQPDLYQSLIQL